MVGPKKPRLDYLGLLFFLWPLGSLRDHLCSDRPSPQASVCPQGTNYTWPRQWFDHGTPCTVNKRRWPACSRSFWDGFAQGWNAFRYSHCLHIVTFEQWRDDISALSHGKRYSRSLFVKVLHILPKIDINQPQRFQCVQFWHLSTCGEKLSWGWIESLSFRSGYLWPALLELCLFWRF